MRTRSILAAALAVPWLGAFGCATPAPTGPGAEAVAELGGQAITLEELDDYVKDELFAEETRGGNPGRTYELRSDALERMLAERALDAEARRRGVSVETLVAQELAANPVTEEEVAAFYERHAEQLKGASLEEIEPRIREHLDEQRTEAFTGRLLAEGGVAILLTPPRVEMAATGPSLGPVIAPVTIVEFSDFQCPYCRRAGPVVRQILARRPNEVRFVYRHLPLDRIHPRARITAEASVCADEQGGFWPYHDLVFENPNALTDRDLRRYALEAGLDPVDFDECLSSGRSRARVEEDAAAAQAVGITGTPAFVVNGIVLFGFQTEARLEEIIQRELEAATATSAVP